MSFNRPTASKGRATAGRNTPRLWVEGRQQPRLEVKSFARVSLLLSRRMARPLLLGSARLFVGGSGRVVENTLGPRLATASRLGRALPSREAVARGLSAVAGFLTKAADIAEPPPAVDVASPPEPRSRPFRMTRRPRQADLRLADLPLADPEPVSPPPPEPTPAPRATDDPDLDAPTIAAIRAMIDEMRDVAPAKPAVAPRRAVPVPPPPPSGRVLLTRGVPLTPAEPRPPTFGERLAARVLHLAAGLVAGLVTLGTLPVGMVRAVITHLHGHDLRTFS